MNKKIYIIDSISYSSFHEMFNACMLYIIANIYKDITYKASFTSYQSVLNALIENGLQNELKEFKFKKIKVFTPGNNSMKALFRYFFSVLQNLKCLISSEKGSQIIYLNNNPFSTWLLSLINKILKKDILIFCHAELESLIQNPQKTEASYYFKYLLNRQFKHGKIDSKIKMCVLGEHILNNLTPFLNESNIKQFYFIRHPYFFKNRENDKITKNNKLTIGTIGVLTSEKGLESFKRIAKKTKDVSLVVNGRLIGNIDKSKYPNVKFISDEYTEFIPRYRYEDEIKLMDYMLFLYGKDTYKFTASGAILDAIDFEKPVIALKNDCFKNLEKFEVGYFFDTEEEIIDFINIKLPTIKEQEYNRCKKNISEVKKIYSIESVRKQLINVI